MGSNWTIGGNWAVSNFIFGTGLLYQEIEALDGSGASGNLTQLKSGVTTGLSEDDGRAGGVKETVGLIKVRLLGDGDWSYHSQ